MYPLWFSCSPRIDFDRLKRRNGLGFALLDVVGLAGSTELESMELQGDVSAFAGSMACLRLVDLSNVDPIETRC